MKFNEFLKQNPDFWNTIEGYPSVAVSQVNDWFYYRDCCTDDQKRFYLYLSRKLNLIQPQFNNLWTKQALLNFEPGTLEKVETTIDYIKEEGVKEAIQKALNQAVKDTGTTNNIIKFTGSDTDKEERNLTSDTKRTGTETRESDNTQTNNTTSTNTKTGTEKRKEETMRTDNLEEKTTGSNTESGTITTVDNGTRTDTQKYSDYPQSTPALGFDGYTSTAQINDSVTNNNNTVTRDLEGTNNGSRENTGTVTTDTDVNTTYDVTDTRKDTGTIKNDGTDTLTLDTSDATTQTGSVTSTYTKDSQNDSTLTLDTEQTTDASEDTNRTNDLNSKANTVISTLRTGNLEDAFEKYFRLATNFNAIAWLIGQLDEVFIQIYDFEECCNSTTGGSSADIEELQKQIDALKLEIQATMDYAESIHDDLTNVETKVNKNSDDIATVTQVASENSAEIVANTNAITNLTNKRIQFKTNWTVDGETDTLEVNIIADLSLNEKNEINRLKMHIPTTVAASGKFLKDILNTEFDLPYVFSGTGNFYSHAIMKTTDGLYYVSGSVNYYTRICNVQKGSGHVSIKTYKSDGVVLEMIGSSTTYDDVQGAYWTIEVF